MAADDENVLTSQEGADINMRIKVLWIDPEVAINEDIIPLSGLSTNYAEALAQYRRVNTEVVHLRMADEDMWDGRI